MLKNNAHDSRFSYILPSLVFCLAAVIIGIGYSSYRTYSRHFRMQVEYQLSAIADLKVDELVQWRKERLGDGSVFFKNTIFSALVQRYFENLQDAESREQLQSWLGLVKENYSYNRISLFDTHGVRRLTMPDDMPPPVSATLLPLIHEVMRSKKMVFQDFYRNDQDQRIYLAAVVPVIDSRDSSNRVLGILVLRIDPEQYLYPLLKRWPTASSTAETLIVRRDGVDALFLSELKFQQDTALTLRIPLTKIVTPAVQAVLGREGIFDGVDYRGIPVIAALRRVPDSPWFLVARMDTAEIFAPLQARFWTTIIVVISIFCGLAAVLFGLWRQQRIRFYREQLDSAQKVQKNAEELQLLFKSMINGFVLFESIFDDSGRFISCRFVYINDACERIIGVKIFEVTGKTLHEVFPETEPEWFDRFGEVVLTGVSQTFDQCHAPTKKTYHCNVYRPGGLSDRFCVVFEDNTERKQAERALALQAKIATIFIAASDEEMYSEVLQVILDVMESPFGVFGYLDADGSLIVPTMTRQIWDRCQMPDKTIRFPRESWGCSSWPRAIREKKANYTNERSFKTPERHIALDRHISLPIMLGGQVIGLFQVANKESDYTDVDVQRLQSIANYVAPILSARLGRERYEKELMEINAELTRFTYTMSHDLKSPLVTVKTFLGYLEKDMQKQDAERIKKDFFFIRGAADKMGRLLDELLELTRIGRIMNPEVVAPLQDIVQEALGLVAGGIAERGVQVEITQQPLLLRGDRVRLVELFQNLVENAVKFMGDQKEPKIEIGLKTKNGEKFLFMRDNGMGIDPRYKDKLFGLFEKLNPEIEGTGMGLALVKRIVEVHGGRIWVESEGLGKGACFWFSLPKGSSEP